MPPSVGSVEMTNSGLMPSYVVDVLPAHAVAVLFLDAAHDHDLVALGDEAHVLHHLGRVGGRSHAALLVGAAAAADELVGPRSPRTGSASQFSMLPMPTVSMWPSMAMILSPVAHEAHHVAQAVNLDLVKAELLHLGLDAGHNVALLAGLAGVGDHGAQERSHVRVVGLRRFLDLVVVEFLHWVLLASGNVLADLVP